MSGGTATWLPPSYLVPENFGTLAAIVEAYEAEQARACAAVRNCRTDEAGEDPFARRLIREAGGTSSVCIFELVARSAPSGRLTPHSLGGSCGAA